MTPSPTNGRKPRVCLSAPRAGGWISWGAAQGVLHWSTHGLCEVAPLFGHNSLLCHNFNGCWAAALSGRESWGFTHLAMLHADVQPQPGWLDILYREMQATGAEVISAVVPIGSREGLTSTAVASEDDWWTRRLTMTEIHDLPETFGPDDVSGYGPGPLLINTGCWLSRIDRPWCDQLTDLGELAMHFHTLDRIIPLPNGQFAAQVQPEDWLFSRYLHRQGVPYRATRKVTLTHLKEVEYPNSNVWGTQARDEKYFNRAAQQVSALREIKHAEDPVSPELHG